MAKKHTVAIAMPVFGDYVKSKTVFALMEAVRAVDFDYHFLMRIGADVASLRNGLVQDAREKGATHILFVDYDMYFPPKLGNSPIQLLLDYDKDIIGGAYNKRRLPLQSTAIPIDGNKISPYRCHALGTGFMLIKMSVFEKLPSPWFLFGYNQEGEMLFGEDTYFCQQAIKAGFDVWACDFGVKHIGEYSY